MALLAYSIYDREYLKSISILNTNKKETTIFKGVFPFSKEEVMIETLNRNDPYYVDLNPSVNQNGGAEYSYNFWVYFNIKDKTNNLILDNPDKKYIVLFYKGARQLIPYIQYNYACDTFDRISKMQSQPYILVKNPLVKISNDGKQIIVEYNNLNTPDTFNSSASPIVCSTLQDIYGNNSSGNPENVKNKLGVKQIDTDKYNKTYNMVTIVMQETPSNEDVLFQNRTNCKVYFNGSLISDRSTYNNDLLNTLSTDSLSTAMKSNMGNLYINPYKTFYDSGTIDKSPPDTYHTQTGHNNTTVNEITETDGITKDVPLKMANLTYYNYALSVDEIYKLYNKGYSNDLADILSRNNPDVNKNINKGAKINFDVYSSDDTTKLPVQSI
jgi:hypothetical protein